MEKKIQNIMKDFIYLIFFHKLMHSLYLYKFLNIYLIITPILLL